MPFYILFNSITAISEQWKVDNGRLCAMELHLQLSKLDDKRITSDNFWITFSYFFLQNV